MDIEELAFKDRTQLANLNELDLLNIIEFLQKDRKEWINQFTQTHNESVEIQEENKKQKEVIDMFLNKVEKNKMLLNNPDLLDLYLKIKEVSE